MITSDRSGFAVRFPLWGLFERQWCIFLIVLILDAIAVIKIQGHYHVLLTKFNNPIYKIDEMKRKNAFLTIPATM